MTCADCIHVLCNRTVALFGAVKHGTAEQAHFEFKKAGEALRARDSVQCLECTDEFSRALWYARDAYRDGNTEAALEHIKSAYDEHERIRERRV